MRALDPEVVDPLDERSDEEVIAAVPRVRRGNRQRSVWRELRDAYQGRAQPARAAPARTDMRTDR